MNLTNLLNQEESIARASTLYSSLITDAASQFYTRYLDSEDPGNAYYTHAMVYSPGVVLIRDDDGEWRSPVEVDVLTSAAVNAGEIRHGLERVEMEYWRKRGEERRREKRNTMVERQTRRLREEAKNRNEKVEVEKPKENQENTTSSPDSGLGSGSAINASESRRELEREKLRRVEMENIKKRGEERRMENQKAMTERQREEAKNKREKEQANFLVKLQKRMVKRKETDIGKAKDSGSEKGEEVDGPDSRLGSECQVKDAEENTESKGTPEVNQELTSSSTIVHPLLPPTQPSQAPDPDPNSIYALALALKNAEIQIQQTMYARISRILHLFQLYQTPHLILGSFGTGVFKNRIDLIATIFADLLIKPGGRFKNVFETVVFAILGKETVRVFTEVFLRVDNREQREGTGKTCVCKDLYMTEGDVKEGDEEKTMRMMRWEERRRRRRNTLYPGCG
jgi:hypothetical protein